MTTLEELRIALEALKEIKAEQGQVCAGFELCHHTSCASSYAAWAIADGALTVLGGRGNG